MNEQQTVPTPIRDLAELTAALQLAVGVELSTIPVYLTALYSIEEGHNADAAQTIRSVVMEEMLHMTLAANVLNALGTRPSTEPVNFQSYTNLSPIPSYPLISPVISGLGILELRPFSPDAVETFLRIEHPLHGADYLTATSSVGYQTIGQFYHAITTALNDDHIVQDSDFAHGNQVPSTQYYGGAGQVIEVIDRASAVNAINKIVDEGEGLPQEALGRQAVIDGDDLGSRWKMYSHYARFRELRTGRRFRRDQTAGEKPEGAILPIEYDAVHPALHDPHNSPPTDSPEHAALIAFDLAYTQLIDNLYHALSGRNNNAVTGHNGAAATAESQLQQAVHGMYALKNMAIGLMRIPHPNSPGHTLCPRFCYVTHNDRAHSANRPQN
ncbi:ferritin-like domain-containing protein [Nocardia abscessus]|uniref:ferritin-like domain-containing protein n=1 Tax=Nocardia abscessus TaxID=120957 RepID=UPI0002D79907|nr:ferritin-like protein [Nocardia abscessus]MCC3331826.1 ferritin-like protein [Nocardia abscessus]